MHRKQHRPLTRRQIALRVASISLVLLIILAAIYKIGRALESRGIPETRGSLSARQTEAPVITYKDEKYQLSPKITTVLFIGVDREGNGNIAKYRENGQADFLLLLVINEKAKTVTPVQIDRDTMTDIAVTNVLGKPSGTRELQICLSHGFGSTDAQGCELTADAVSTLLLGASIDYYVSVNLDGISALNDAVGGITVTLENDFSGLDPAMSVGSTLTLHGEQAEYYVRQRYGIADSSNAARMSRQSDYLSKYGAALDERIQADSAFAGTLFDALEPYMTTDMKRGNMINTAWNTKDYTRMEIRRPEGEHSYGDDGFIEFHADEASVAELVIELFYQPINDVQ